MTEIQWIPQTEREFLASLTPPLAVLGTRGRFGRLGEEAIAKARREGFGFIGDKGHPQTPVKAAPKPKTEKTVVTQTVKADKPVTVPAQAGDTHVDAATVRQWANETGVPVGLRGRLHPDVLSAYKAAHGSLPVKAPKVSLVKAAVEKPAAPAGEVARPIVKQTKTRKQTVAYGRVRRGDAPKHITEPILAISSCYSCKNPVAYCTHPAPIMPRWAGGEAAHLTKAEAK